MKSIVENTYIRSTETVTSYNRILSSLLFGFPMDRENISSDDSYSSHDEIQTLAEVTAIPVPSSCDSSSTTSTVAKTARDKFFTNFQNDMEKKRCSAECLLCETPKRIVDKLGVTSNFTRHARESHKQAFDAWVVELNQWKSANSKTSTNKSLIFHKKNMT